MVTQCVVLPGAAEAETPAPGGDFADLSLQDLLDTVVTVSTPRGVQIFDSPSTVSIVDRATIEEFGFSSVAEAVGVLAGVWIGRTYFEREVPTLRGVLQDHYANKVLVLIDGVPAWMAVTGEAQLERVALADIDRIEVLKGPASVIYGTNAYAGAINLVLVKAKRGSSRGRVSASASAPLGTSGGGSFAWRGEVWRVMVNAYGGERTDASRTFQGEQGGTMTLSEHVDTSHLTLRVGAETRYGTHTLLANLYRTEETFLGVRPRISEGAGLDHVSYGALVHYGGDFRINDGVQLRAGWSLDWNERDFPRSKDGLEHSRVAGYRSESTLGVDLDLTPWLVLNVGGAFDYRRSMAYENYRTDTGELLATNNLRGRRVWEAAGTAQLRFSLEPLYKPLPMTLLLGARYTFNEFFDEDFSLRGTLVYRFLERQSLKLVAGQSFRAPTLFELYFETPSQTVSGTTTLQPEKSTSVELAYLIGAGAFFGQVTGYWARYENKIFRIQKDDGAYVYANGGTFDAGGIEMELMVRDPRILDAFFNYTVVFGGRGDATDKDPEHYNFRYVPQHLLSAGIGRRFHGFFASTRINWTYSPDGVDGPLGSQATWDASLGYRSATFGLHTLSVKNLLDADRRIPEYVRRNLSSLSDGQGRSVSYRFQYDF